MNVLEFIREKREDLQENAAQFKAMLEPTFQSWTNKINNHITNTLNNPWISGFNPFESNNLFSSGKIFQDKIASKTFENLRKQLGKEIYVGEWEVIDQNCINQFADVTGDQQWIHTDPERAKIESPFKTTIAHGFLTLALLPKLTDAINLKENFYPETRLVVNYGLNQVRFPFPVKSNSRVRAIIRLKNVTALKKSIEVINEINVEVENRKRYACVAETVLRLYF
ncbi:MAG: protein dehydratase [Candidatus Marinimicrobia bacterium]|nr:protein dehydratase [Candidatus Neomarinimicrobiota bacterium]|tara:strand:+ start:236 stop:910 length:675 start_codon:yes stop_codon:yes gene_type:complete